MAHCFEVPRQVGTDEMAEMEEMVRKGTEGNQEWDLRALLEKKVKRSKQGDLLVVVVVVVNLYLSTVQNSSALKIPDTNIIKIFKYNKNI